MPSAIPRTADAVVYRLFLRVSMVETTGLKEDIMKGYVRRRGDRYYAVIYEGRDPVTGRERRTWHPAGTDQAEAERLAAKLATVESEKIGAVRALTFGAYLTGQWLPGKKLHLAATTYRGYERNVQLHVLPALGKVAIRRLRYQQIEAFYERLLHPVTGWRIALLGSGGLPIW